MLVGHAAPEAAAHPTIFDLTSTEDEAALARLLESKPDLRTYDTIDRQLEELARTRHPGGLTDLPGAVRTILGDLEPHRYGRWVHYPWADALVHLLPPDAYRELRTDRNRYKILPDEQARLGAARIGVVGLSVGHSAALTCVLEGIGGQIRLADFDALDLSNLNRLRARTIDIGTNKAKLAARALYEIDPYLSIQILDEGICDENIDRFLTEGGALDLLVEECDDLAMKVRLRQRARELRIPVLMDTSDRGLLDVERYDLEPERPILHGLVPEEELTRLEKLTTKEKVPLVLAILGGRSMSPALGASLIEINQTISTWPQLGSAVCLGGALVADLARRILLGSDVGSGRYYVDLDELVAPERVVTVERPEEQSDGDRPVPSQAKRPGVDPKPGDIEYVVAHAVLAPSGGNVQPWRFEARDRTIDCYVDERRSVGLLNSKHLASFVALGAAIENAVLAASASGFDVEVLPPIPERPLHAGTLKLSKGPKGEPALFSHIPRRTTHRALAEPRPIEEETVRALTEAAEAFGATLQIVTDRQLRRAVGEAVGLTDRVRFLSSRMHRELVGELRFTPAEVLETRDGIDVETLELSKADRAVLEVLCWPEAMELLGRTGQGRAIVKSGIDAMDRCSAAALLSVPDGGSSGLVTGGRALQRVWLEATARGLGVQPRGVLLFLSRLLALGLPFEEEEASQIRDARSMLSDVFGESDRTEVMLLRLSHSDPPVVRSLRRPVEESLVILE